jgi:glucose-6-phosphate 1-dehydrogenase
VAYYLDKDLVNKSTLIDIRRVKDTYNSENITNIIIPILEEIGIISRLGYFIGDNAGPNDTY